ncbi:hypothetical protein [Guptibacillus hwajinpoensis]|uniref:hypothetical protein n=1 Tax=Guptibacillus hwajinpoensis TaxID=208199 RepID=UPI003D0811EB
MEFTGTTKEYFSNFKEVEMGLFLRERRKPFINRMLINTQMIRKDTNELNWEE